jgi:hypothetical protein
MKTQCIFYTVGTEFVTNIYIKFILQNFKKEANRLALFSVGTLHQILR